MFTIGLTGGIGCGKSTVSAYIASCGYEIIDADAMSRRLTSEPGPVLDEIRAAFGPSVFDPEGHLDRRHMATLVFHDPVKKSVLEEIVTRRVKEAITGIIAARAGERGLLFLDVPLLYEYGTEHLCDAVWVVTSPERLRIARVRQRDGATVAEVRARIRNQMPQKEKAKLADDVIRNNGSLEHLYAQTARLIEKYARLTEEAEKSPETE